MKIISLRCFIVAALGIATLLVAVAAAAPPEAHHRSRRHHWDHRPHRRHMNDDLDKVSFSTTILDGDQCRHLFKALLRNHGPEDHTGVYAPYNSLFNYPVEDLQWTNFTNTRITAGSFEDCVVKYDRTHELYTVVAKGVDATVEGDFAYSWEAEMPVLDDSGSYRTQVNKSAIAVYLKRFDVKEYLKDIADKDTVAPTVVENGDDKHVWRAFATTFIPKIAVKTHNTKYAEYYDKLAQRHEAELRFMMSLVANSQIASWFNHYCLEHDCDQAIEAAVKDAIVSADKEKNGHQNGEMAEETDDNGDNGEGHVEERNRGVAGDKIIAEGNDHHDHEHTDE